MKKVLSVLGLIAVLSMSTPVFAAPGGPGGPSGGPGMPGGPHGGGHRIHAGVHHPHHIRPHGGFTVHAGHPRHRYWRSYGSGYWGRSWCDYRLGYCDDFYYRTYYAPGFGINIHF